MAADMFIKVGDIKGESTDHKHKDEIEIHSWSWGVMQPGSMGSGGGGGAGKASFNELTFTHSMDKASPNLLTICATGDHVDKAVLTVRKAGKEQQEYLVITMDTVFVTAVQDGGSDGGGIPTESVNLQFAKVDLEYKPQKKDGSLEAGVHFKYDIKENKTF